MVAEEQSQSTGDRRSRLYRITGIILRRRNLGESDRILTVYSKELGKHRCVAKGIRRPGSKMGGHTEPFMVANMLIARARNLPIVSQAEAVRSFPRLRENERSIAAAGLMAERVESLTAEDQAQPGIFNLLEGALDLLDQGAHPGKVQIMFDQLLLQETGYRPELTNCLNCGSVIGPEPNGFQLVRGGVVCPRCIASQAGTIPLSVDALKIMRLIDRGEPGRFLSVRIGGRTLDEVAALLSSYVTSITGRDSSASRVIRDLRLEYSYADQAQRPEDDDGLHR